MVKPVCIIPSATVSTKFPQHDHMRTVVVLEEMNMAR